ncbi:MAG: hypothetical protein B6I24_07980 [Bacteroidetes bacterium 4572_128]|nr:MAG: hypothetical protein B6I24_07980 [Bacteroidetes bacterium 4572_128]
MLSFLSNLSKLVRLPNLLIIALSQYLLRYCVIHPLISTYSFSHQGINYHFKGIPQLSDFNFFLLVMAMVLLTASGYVINDYFDRKTDALNRPDEIIVGKHIHRRFAIQLHFILNVISVSMGFYVSYEIGFYQLGFLFLIATGVLWYYSTSYKKQFLIGNLVVAVFAGMAPLMIVLFEVFPLMITYKQTMVNYQTNFNIILFWGFGYSFFAFMTNLTREIIKDIEDFEGDNAYGINSLPIVIGINASKIIIISLSIITLISIFCVYHLFLNDNITLIYFIISFGLTNLFLIYKIIKANYKKDYRFASILSKIIMVLGILYSLVVYFKLS